MKDFVIEIKPKKLDFDPLAQNVKTTLKENNEDPDAGTVSTERLYRLTGSITDKQIKVIAQSLLVDPVVETFHITDMEKSGKKSEKNGWQLDVWPKKGVTDPVGETVEKGIKDLGISGSVRASSATRYLFPKVKSSETISTLAKQYFANELIHDIDIRKIGN